MRRKRSLYALILSVSLAAGMILPSAAAEVPGDSTRVMESGEEEDAGEEMKSGQEDSEGIETPLVDIDLEGDPEEGDGTGGDSGTSSWLSDYSYEIRDGELFLTSYQGQDQDVTVPGSAYVDNVFYSRVYLTVQMWGTTVEDLAFETGVTLPADSSHMFSPSEDDHRGIPGLVSIDTEHLDTSQVTVMDFMFGGCEGLGDLDLSGLDTSSVVSMKGMFERCYSLHSLDLSGFDTSDVTDMSSMFDGSYCLESLDLSSFDTSAVTDMSRMFFSCESLGSLDLSGFDTSSVTSMAEMFSNCAALGNLNISCFDTSSVTDMETMFKYCSSINSLDVSSFDTSSVVNMKEMFFGCISLSDLDLSGFDTSAVQDMQGLFYACRSLSGLDLSGFDTSSVRNMSLMFFNCRALESLNLSGFDTSSVTDMSEMFENCSGLTDLDLTGFDTSSVEHMDIMFCGCSSLKNLDMSSFDLSSLTSADYMMDLQSQADSLTICTPKNLSLDVTLEGTGDVLCDGDGNSYTSLPVNLAVSIRISRGTGPVFTARPSYVQEEGSVTGYVAAAFEGPVSRGVWQYREAGEDTWTDYAESTDQAVLKRLDIPGSSEWGGRSVRLVLFNSSNAPFASDEVVLPERKHDIAGCTIQVSDCTYTGEPLVPEVSVTMGDYVLAEGKDYTLALSDNMNAGTGRAVFTGTGDFTGSVTVSFTIKRPAMLATPAVSSVTNVKNGIRIAWSRVEGAEKYRIYYKEGTGSWKRLAETAGTSYTWTGAGSGKTYSFTLRCMNAAGTAFTSGYDNIGKTIVYIASPSVTKLESLSGGVKITWTESAGAALYRIYYKEGSGGWKKLAETADTSYTWTGAESGKTYGFTVRCMNAAGTAFTSGYDVGGMTMTYTKPVSIPEVTALSAVTGGLQISWSSYEGAGVYAVYYKTGTGAGGWKKLTNVSGTSYTWTGAVDGTTYSFTVRAMNAEGTSFISGYNNTGMSIAYKALVSIPRVTSVMNVQGGVKIAWSAFEGAGSYRIFYREGGGAWKKLTDARGTSYTWTGAEGGAAYAFTVRAMNAAATSYVSGYDNTGKAITYVASPVITDLQQVTGGIEIAWDACPGAGTYRIFVKTNGGGWKKLADTADPSYTWTGAVSGNTYSFTVRCMDAESVNFVSGYDNTGVSLNF